MVKEEERSVGFYNRSLIVKFHLSQHIDLYKVDDRQTDDTERWADTQQPVDQIHRPGAHRNVQISLCWRQNIIADIKLAIRYLQRVVENQRKRLCVVSVERLVVLCDLDLVFWWLGGIVENDVG